MIKVKKRKILLLPGDGIGPEVINEVKKVIKWLNTKRSLDFQIDEDLVGGVSYDKYGTPITDEVFYKALESEVVMLGAVGGPKWDNVDFSKKPERALLKLRKELKLFANLRPAICLKQIAGLKLANNFNSFLNFNNALSGFLEKSKLSHFGPPTAPNITTALSKAL